MQDSEGAGSLEYERQVQVAILAVLVVLRLETRHNTARNSTRKDLRRAEALKNGYVKVS